MRTPLRLLALAAVAALWTGCSVSHQPIGLPLRRTIQFAAEWKRYLALDSHKSMAVAGDLRGRYAMGYAFAGASEQMVVESALMHCEQRRTERRIDSGCTTYAIGDRIVNGQEEMTLRSTE